MEEHIQSSEFGSPIGKEKVTFLEWVKAHKKELIFAGIGIATLIGMILGIKNKDSIESLWESMQKSIAKVPADKVVVEVAENSIPITETVSATDIVSLSAHREYKAAFDVTDHIRNLHKGWCASREKVAAAEAHDIKLLSGQTWVENYIKGTIVG